MEQTPFIPGQNTFAENPEPRCPSILLLDVSGSMHGEPISLLQEGVGVYRDSLFADELAKKRVEVAIVTFGGKVEVVQSFTTVDTFAAPALAATGDTPMGEAVVTALKLLEDRKAEYRAAGVKRFRPWVFLITDGAPTDDKSHYWSEAKQQIKDGEEGRKFSFFTVAVENADMERLTELNPKRPPLKLKGLEFRKLFQWLSSSQRTVSQTNPGDDAPVQLQNPTAGPQGWATV